MERDAQRENSIIEKARALIAERFHGVLATLSTEYPGYPFGSVLPYSLDDAGWPMILVSDLAQHTKHLAENPRCSLVLREHEDGDIQQQMRLTMLADALPIEDIDPALAARHFRYFPASRSYFEELNFRFLRLAPFRFHCVGGFGAARWIGTERLRDKLRFSLKEESRLLELVNGELTHHLHRVYRSAFFREQSPENPTLAVGLDRNGIDLRHDDHLCRRSFPEPVSSTDELCAAIARL